MLEFLLFALLGIFVGIVFGLVPGLHPNFLILLTPLLFSVSAAPQNLICFVVAMAVSNAIVDFLPSILFGAPEEGTELSVNPGHRMLLEGRGYQAVKLAVTGGLLAVAVLAVLFPVIIIVFPLIYGFLQPALFFLLLGISLYMILTEEGAKKLLSGVCFLFAGVIGLSLQRLPLDSTVMLFPVLSGMFGASVLAMQFRKRGIIIGKQKPEEYISRRLIKRSVIFGSLGGIFSGLLPGVGTSQVASLATVDKNEKSFLLTLGALATSNIIISVISLWLIGKTRSGAAVIIDNFLSLSLPDVFLVLFVALFAGAVSALAALRLAKVFLHIIEKINYVIVSKIVFIAVFAMVIVFTGVYGLLLFAVCASLGIFAYLSKIKMSVMMAVLLVPTIIFYYPF
ncbi:MAG: tripartite tricarboxylate transporter permease [Candidatus Aenigmarchaeota archaeon]|nr:tripartite tricarboxylate transporter permease [Candidatus Aenigmarchaeota archaeon]